MACEDFRVKRRASLEPTGKVREACIRLIRGILAALLMIAATPAWAEDGYDLWLRYRPLAQDAQARFQPRATSLLLEGSGPVIDAAARELGLGLRGMLGRHITKGQDISDGAILIGTPTGSPRLAKLDLPLDGLGGEGYLIRSMRVDGRAVTVIAANEGAGVLYGVFHYLRLVRSGQGSDPIDISSAPRVKLRVLNHWDNLDRTVERGYAGQSIWDWWKLPAYKDPRYTDYARANASIGINGTVLNNVNAKADSLTAPYIAKAAAVADVLRPYGMRVYLSARFSAPIEIGGLKTADPLDPAVRAWWRAKADEIYRTIPDFGGFLVKANSEGQPGPQDYKRSHADGANMLAEAVAPHRGIVMWRAFVYAAENPVDRVRQAYDEFKPLDGKFADNVLVQVKNGPLDFQPREPFHPLFGAMPSTPLMAEFQITKEYLGFATHLVYLGTAWEEVLKADTHAKGRGSSVAEVVDGSLERHRLTGMAGVANIGSDRNWSGSIFDQANWYAFGRLAWDPAASARTIAEEWIHQTFDDPSLVKPVADMMMGSREAAVNYMTPLGLTHLMATGHHFGPGPWVDDLGRPDWNPFYYHRADGDGIGFDRGPGGSNAVAQYAPALARQFSDVATTPERYLLWFHRLGWDHRMSSGRTLWEELVARYSLGVSQVTDMRRQWAALQGKVDAARFEQTASFLAIQEQEAKWWRDACLAYFSAVARRPIPPGYDPPARSLEAYKAISFPYAPGHH